MNARPNQLRSAIIGMATRYGSACTNRAYAFARVLHGNGDQDAVDSAERACDRRFAALQRLTAALARTAEDTRVPAVRGLCDSYKGQPPPIFRGPGLSERGEGYNAGTRDLARAVLSTLDGDCA